MRIGLVCLIGVLLASTVATAQHPILGSVSLRNTDQGVNISFVIKGGNTCNGINIFHSGDTSAFILTGEIAGICGHSDNDTRYEYTHLSPIPFDTNYYYLDFGGVGPSKVIAFYFVPFNKADLVLRRVEDQLNIHVKTSAGEEVQLEVFDLQGNLISKGHTSFGQAQLSFQNLKGLIIVSAIWPDGQRIVRKTVIL